MSNPQRSVMSEDVSLDVGPILDVLTDKDTAFLYILTLTHDGHKDWRFPTRSEFDVSGDIWFEGVNYTNSHGEIKWRAQPVRDKEVI